MGLCAVAHAASNQSWLRTARLTAGWSPILTYGGGESWDGTAGTAVSIVDVLIDVRLYRVGGRL